MNRKLVFVVVVVVVILCQNSIRVGVRVPTRGHNVSLVQMPSLNHYQF